MCFCASVVSSNVFIAFFTIDALRFRNTVCLGLRWGRFTTEKWKVTLCDLIMALNGLFCADVPLENYSLTPYDRLRSAAVR